MQIKAIHQFSPACSPGDGVTNGMFFTRRLLRELGFASEIYSEHIPPPLNAEVRPLPAWKPQPGELLFMHHCLGYENSEWLSKLAIPKVMVYHNITPVSLLPKEGNVRRLAMLGRRQLSEWPAQYLGAIGDSGYNSAELQEANYKNIATIPLLVDTDRVREAPWDRGVMEPLRDRLNLLFVGRICENKHQLELVETMREFLHFTDQPARLILAGGTTSDGYRKRILGRIHELGLQDHVILTGKVPDAALLALYRSADAFVCLSEHEGFGMPLIESMLFDVPVVARGISSIPDTLGEGGLLLQNEQPRDIAALLHTLVSEPALRRRVIAGQRRNLERFTPRRVREQLAAYLTQLGIQVPRPPVNTGNTDTRPYCRIEGPFDSSYSLAIVNRELGRALAKRGNDVGLRSMEGAGDFTPSPGFTNLDPECAALVRRAGKDAAAPDISLRFCYPPHVDDMRGRVRAVHSYGWEETGFPAEYVAAFNRRLDMVTVLSTFVEKVLRDNGVRVPIAVTGGGVDHLLHVAAQPPTLPLRGFRFLHVSSCFPRKGIDALLSAYGKAFRDGDDVTLVIKTFSNPHNDVAQQIAHLREADAEYPHVVLIEHDSSQPELAGLYKACHAFVAPSRGEGLGLPMAEAMLFSLPVITTGWSGQLDFCTPSTAWLCDYHFARAETHFGLSHSVWADPDVEHLARLLREVHRLTPNERAQRTNLARDRVLRDFTWDRVAQRTEQALTSLALQPLFRSEPAVGWISTWNTRCGIASYSAFLTMAIPADRLTVFANRTDERTAPDAQNVVRCWNMVQEEPMDEVCEQAIARGIQAVVIQYNNAFIALSGLSRLIKRLKQAGIAVHCFFHATAEHWIGERLITLADIADALAQCDRIYVHGVQDLNCLKGYGLIDNVVLFPQGVLPTPVAADQEAERKAAGVVNKKVIASYGFLLPHKGLQQLIQAFAELAKDDASLHLMMVNALYPKPESADELQACQTLILELGLGKRVTMVTDFLTDAQSLAKLQLADLIVFPYQNTKESSSAAVRMGLAADRPIAVTPLGIFDDVADAVHRLPGTEPAAIAAGIRQLLGDSAMLEQQAVRSRQWVASRQWPHLSTRLLNLIDGLANRLPTDAGHV